MDCSLPGSSVHGIFLARILQWVAIPFSRGSSQPRDRTRISSIAGGFFTSEPLGKPHSQVYCYRITGMTTSSINPVQATMFLKVWLRNGAAREPLEKLPPSVWLESLYSSYFISYFTFLECLVSPLPGIFRYYWIGCRNSFPLWFIADKYHGKEVCKKIVEKRPCWESHLIIISLLLHKNLGLTDLQQ